jgi:hypothetical protein
MAVVARVALSLAFLAALAAPASAAPAAGSGSTTGGPWATVNVCDTSTHPNDVGIRASMPGAPRRTLRRMRFRIQYRVGTTWHYVSAADSGWRKLAVARGRPIESGWTFEFAPQQAPITFRGVVRFRWLRDGAVVRKGVEITEAGHRSTVGADPAGYSAATCSMG